MNEQTTTAASLPAACFALLPLAALQLNDYNARRFTENMTPQRQARFDELVESVRTMGVLEPLLVREVAAQHYEIIAGERRYRAALRVAVDCAEKMEKRHFAVSNMASSPHICCTKRIKGMSPANAACMG